MNFAMKACVLWSCFRYALLRLSQLMLFMFCVDSLCLFWKYASYLFVCMVVLSVELDLLWTLVPLLIRLACMAWKWAEFARGPPSSSVWWFFRNDVARSSAFTFIAASDVSIMLLSLSWWALIHLIVVWTGSSLMRSAIDDTISALASGYPGCFVHDRKCSLAREAALLLHVCTSDCVSILWAYIVVIVRNSKLDAIPNNSARVELFAFMSPSTGPEHIAIVSCIVSHVLDSRRHQPKEHLLSPCMEPSVAILIDRPNFKWQSSRAFPDFAKWRCSSRRKW